MHTRPSVYPGSRSNSICTALSSAIVKFEVQNIAGVFRVPNVVHTVHPKTALLNRAQPPLFRTLEFAVNPVPSLLLSVQVCRSLSDQLSSEFHPSKIRNLSTAIGSAVMQTEPHLSSVFPDKTGELKTA